MAYYGKFQTEAWDNYDFGFARQRKPEMMNSGNRG
jgi:hypothetical protein